MHFCYCPKLKLLLTRYFKVSPVQIAEYKSDTVADHMHTIGRKSGIIYAELPTLLIVTTYILTMKDLKTLAVLQD